MILYKKADRFLKNKIISKKTTKFDIIRYQKNENIDKMQKNTWPLKGDMLFSSCGELPLMHRRKMQERKVYENKTGYAIPRAEMDSPGTGFRIACRYDFSCGGNSCLSYSYIESHIVSYGRGYGYFYRNVNTAMLAYGGKV